MGLNLPKRYIVIAVEVAKDLRWHGFNASLKHRRRRNRRARNRHTGTRGRTRTKQTCANPKPRSTWHCASLAIRMTLNLRVKLPYVPVMRVRSHGIRLQHSSLQFLVFGGFGSGNVSLLHLFNDPFDRPAVAHGSLPRAAGGLASQGRMREDVRTPHQLPLVRTTA